MRETYLGSKTLVTKIQWAGADRLRARLRAAARTFRHSHGYRPGNDTSEFSNCRAVATDPAPGGVYGIVTVIGVLPPTAVVPEMTGNRRVELREQLFPNGVRESEVFDKSLAGTIQHSMPRRTVVLRTPSMGAHFAVSRYRRGPLRQCGFVMAYQWHKEVRYVRQVLSHTRLSALPGQIRVVSFRDFQAGTPLAGTCFEMLPPCHSSSKSSRSGFSMRSFTRTRNWTASRPSMSRWSYERAKYIIGRRTT